MQQIPQVPQIPQILSYVASFSLILAIVAMLVAGYSWTRMQRYLKPELKHHVTFRGMIDSINPSYYDATGMRYRKRALIAYGIMVLGIVVSISANLLADSYTL